MPWPLPVSDEARLRLAKGYPYAAPAGSYLYRDGAATPLAADPDPDLFSGRFPVIAHGSNRAPEQLHRKFSHLNGRASEIPVTRAVLADHDVVYSAHMTRYGAVSATLHAAPGTRVTVFVTWLSAAQLPRMHETELGLGNYAYGRLTAVELAVEQGPRLTEAYAYLSIHGCLADPEIQDAPLALAAVPAEDRRHRAVHQETALALLRDRHAPEAELDGMILSTIADTARRRRLIADLQAAAVPRQVPGFELIEG